jgi:hypothetical protein
VIVDLRDYTTRPGGRDKLIERCETLLFPEQQRLGASFPGVFRDLDDPDRMVWLRAMPDLPTRARVLTAFYTDGAMWKANRREVNSWIADSDDVLLVRPASDFAPPATAPSEVGMYTRIRRTPWTATEITAARTEVEGAIAQAGGRLSVTFVTEPAKNNYPRHRIRTGEHGLVWFASWPTWQALPVADLAQRRLAPTTGSRLR